jgi:hypothetical protein
MLGKKRSGLKSPIRQKNEVLGDTSVFKTKVFTRSKRLKVFDTFFLETEVFTEYFKITLKPNEALINDGDEQWKKLHAPHLDKPLVALHTT